MSTEIKAMDRQVQAAIYIHIYQTGVIPAYTELLRITGISATELQKSVERLVEARILVLAHGSNEIAMAIPFSATPTAYPVKSNGKRYWANCMWDALGIMAALDTDSTLETTCPDCAEPLALATENGALVGDHTVMHILIPANEWWDNISFT